MFDAIFTYMTHLGLFGKYRDQYIPKSIIFCWATFQQIAMEFAGRIGEAVDLFSSSLLDEEQLVKRRLPPTPPEKEKNMAMENHLFVEKYFE